MVKLVLLRHGQSTANEQNRYTGWSDVPLTQTGKQQASQAGKLLYEHQIQFEHLHTSLLSRAIVTANIVLEQIHQPALPTTKTWRLNERHYGALRGMNKDYTRQVYGKHQVALWRRSYFAVPPKLLAPDDDRRYQRYPKSICPLSESLQMAEERIVPYWLDHIAPRLLRGKNQLVVAHGSTLRALTKYLEAIAPQDIDGLEIYNGQPIVYDLDEKLRIKNKQILTPDK